MTCATASSTVARKRYDALAAGLTVLSSVSESLRHFVTAPNHFGIVRRNSFLHNRDRTPSEVRTSLEVSQGMGPSLLTEKGSRI